MNSIHIRSVIIAFTLLTFGASANGGEYSDPAGYSFAYPDGWIAITKDRHGAVAESLPPEAKNWLKNNNIDLKQTSVILIRNAREEFLENMNVIVNRQELPVNERTKNELVDLMAKQLQSRGATVAKVDGGIQKVGSQDAIVLNLESELPFVRFPLRQQQVFFVGGGNTYVVTCTATRDTFATYSPIFDTILASFKLPAPTSRGFDWTRSAITGAIIGAIGGGLVAVLKLFKGKKKTA